MLFLRKWLQGKDQGCFLKILYYGNKEKVMSGNFIKENYLTTIFLLIYSPLLEAVMKYNPGRTCVPKLKLCR
mgnify:CR=1 FL=1